MGESEHGTGVCHNYACTACVLVCNEPLAPPDGISQPRQPNGAFAQSAAWLSENSIRSSCWKGNYSMQHVTYSMSSHKMPWHQTVWPWVDVLCCCPTLVMHYSFLEAKTPASDIECSWSMSQARSRCHSVTVSCSIRPRDQRSQRPLARLLRLTADLK